MKARIMRDDLVTWWPGSPEEQAFMLKCFGSGGTFEIRFMQDTSKTQEPGGGAYFEIRRLNGVSRQEDADMADMNDVARIQNVNITRIQFPMPSEPFQKRYAADAREPKMRGPIEFEMQCLGGKPFEGQEAEYQKLRELVKRSWESRKAVTLIVRENESM